MDSEQDEFSAEQESAFEVMYRALAGLEVSGRVLSGLERDIDLAGTHPGDMDVCTVGGGLGA